MLLERSFFFRMKNKFLKKYLCITLAAAMISGAVVPAAASQESGSGADSAFSDDIQPSVEPTSVPEPEPTQEPESTPEPDIPTETPQPTETPDDPTETPSPTETPDDPTETPQPTVTPGDPTETPSPTVTPGDPTETPSPTVTPGDPTGVPEEDQAVKKVVEGIEALAKEKLTLKHEAKVKELRTAYNALTDEQKKKVTNYQQLVKFEKQISALKKNNAEEQEKAEGLSDGTSAAKSGTPVYYSSMVSNLHAGREFYLDSLKDNYQLSFSDDFEDVMNQIEKEYKEKNGLTDASDTRANGQTASSDSLLVRNWQDILAVYVYRQSAQGITEFKMDSSAKDNLAAIFAEMNPLVRDENNPSHVSYGNYHINTYIKKNNISQEDREVLKKYVETDCKLLCAIVTDAKGFIRQSVGDDVSEERVNVIAAAYSLVGEVGYFWGGKSTQIGADPSWGNAAKVSAAGSPSTGTTRAYGLDCSGFVTWAVINGYQDQGMQQAVGDGTSEQWINANVVSEQDAQPGDLVFQSGPEAGSNNHVGIICGKTDAGDWIAVHCSSSKNGVTVGEAYGASFRYIRQPSFYPDQEELAQMISTGNSADNAEPAENTGDVIETGTAFSDTGSEGSEQTPEVGGEDIFVDEEDLTDSTADLEQNNEIEVVFEDVDTGASVSSDNNGGAGSAEVTDTLQGILDQNDSVSQESGSAAGGGTDLSDIEVVFEN